MTIRSGAALILAAALASATTAPAFAESDAVEAHVEAGKTAAGLDFTDPFTRVCVAPALGYGKPGAPRPAGPRPIPDRALWHAEPVKMFDNLYFLGTKINSSWALTTSKGIILIDTLYNYAAEDEIVDGLKKLGLDPAQIKYVIIAHGHGDHDEGARLLQDRYGAHIVMGGPDWDAIEKGPDMPGGKPKRDIVGHDGDKITLGDTTVTLVATPGHTPGTLSSIFTVKDRGTPLAVAYSGGTALQVIYKDGKALDGYVNSQRHMAKMAADAGATILMSNHSEFDLAYERSRMMASLRPGETHFLNIGAANVQRYFKVLEECGLAQRERVAEGKPGE